MLSYIAYVSFLTEYSIYGMMIVMYINTMFIVYTYIPTYLVHILHIYIQYPRLNLAFML